MSQNNIVLVYVDGQPIQAVKPVKGGILTTFQSFFNNCKEAMSNNDKKQEQPKPTAPKVDKKELEKSIKSHESAKSANQTVKK